MIADIAHGHATAADVLLLIAAIAAGLLAVGGYLGKVRSTIVLPTIAAVLALIAVALLVEL